jgi:uncharacterized membrane protein YdjX (TVP38/TMEM64 family)
LLKRDLFVRGIVTIASVALVVLIIRESGLGTGLDAFKHWIDTEIRGDGLAGALLFVAAGALFTGVGLSRQALAFAAGYAFGVVWGSVLALIAEVGGVLLAFSYARFVGRDVVARHFPSKIKRFDEFLAVNPFWLTLAIRLLPVSNNLVVNLLGGVSRVPTVPFLAASTVGHAPQTIVFALVGSGLAAGLLFKTALAIVLFVISIGIGVHLYRKYRHGTKLDDTLDDILDKPNEYIVSTDPQRP